MEIASQRYISILLKIFFRRLQRQIESIRLQKDPQDKIVERISLSENEKESYNDSKLSHHNKSSQSNNDVYRYFSHSAKVDSNLFNYRKYFSGIAVDPDEAQHDTNATIKQAKSNEVALKKPAAKNLPKINNCHCKTECSRCHKQLEVFCKECTEHAEASPETTNQLELEYNEQELPFTPDQQVVVYRASNHHTPYSFNIDPNSHFYNDLMEEVGDYNDAKMTNYIKLYGDLKKTKLDSKKTGEQMTSSGAVPKRKPLTDKVS